MPGPGQLAFLNSTFYGRMAPPRVPCKYPPSQFQLLPVYLRLLGVFGAAMGGLFPRWASMSLVLVANVVAPTGWRCAEHEVPSILAAHVHSLLAIVQPADVTFGGGGMLISPLQHCSTSLINRTVPIK